MCWEIGALLAAADLPHAIIESDELDRVFPRPDRTALDALIPGASDVSQLNLAALWGTYRSLGHTRLIMSGVMLHVAHDIRWIKAAIPDATIMVVRLRGSDATLLERLDRRETGAGRDAQIERSLHQARRLAGEAAGSLLVIDTDGCTPSDLAQTVLAAVGWWPEAAAH